MVFKYFPLLVCKFVSVCKCPLTSPSGKNLANNGHSSYECKSLAQPPDASAASIFFERSSASEIDFALILSGFFIIFYLPLMTILKDNIECCTHRHGVLA